MKGRLTSPYPLTRGDYKFRTITADKTWFHCKGCLNSYETKAPMRNQSAFRPSIGSVYYPTEDIGKYYLCPNCDIATPN